MPHASPSHAKPSPHPGPDAPGIALPLPALPRLLLGAALKRVRRSAQVALPLRLQGSFEHPGLSAAQQARYRAALGFAPEAPAPLSLAYLALQQAQLALMLRPAFPYRLMGLVHLSQQFRRLGAWSPEQPLRLDLELQVLDDCPTGRREVQILAGLSQRGLACLSAESRYLLRRGRRAASSPKRPEDDTMPPVGDWWLPQDEGRRYARLSGDWNPIHLWPWSARLLGQRQPIIHGMHSLARCEAWLGGSEGLSALQARFTRPVTLGQHLRLQACGQDFALRAAGQAVLVGQAQRSRGPSPPRPASPVTTGRS